GAEETRPAMGSTSATVTIPGLSVAVASHSLASDTLMDTDTAATIPMVATTPTPLITAVATTAAVITVAATTTPVTATLTTVAAIMGHAVIRVPFTPATPTVQATNQAWCACSSDSLEPVTIEARSMELWGLAPTTPCAPTSTI